jgi:outer membrane protein
LIGFSRGFLLLLIISLSFITFNATANELKVSILNTPLILEESLYGKEIRKKMETEFKGRKDDLDARQANLRVKHESFQRDKAILADKDRVTQERELTKLQQSWQQMAEELDIDMRARQQEELHSFEKILEEVVSEIAKTEKYDIIFPMQVAVFNNEKADCTEKVLSKLNIRFKSSNG